MTGWRSAPTLADVLPGVLAHLGAPPGGERAAFRLPPADRVCLALVDGLGTRLLERAADGDAPFLRSLLPSAIHLASGFPSSTPVSLCSLGTGRESGEHGIVGFFLRPTTEPAVIECLTWAEPGTRRPMLGRFPPETLQPFPSRLADAAAHGIRTAVVSLAEHAGSGLTRAAFRGAEWIGLEHDSDVEERVAKVGAALVDAPSLVYTYDPRLDFAAHRAGVESEAWRTALRATDTLLRSLHGGLPAGTLLLVTGDHGAIDVADGTGWISQRGPTCCATSRPSPATPARAISMPARARRGCRGGLARGAGPGALGDPDPRRGDRVRLVRPTVRDAVRPRIGDWSWPRRRRGILLDLGRYPWEATFQALHGGLTGDEVDVPLLVSAG